MDVAELATELEQRGFASLMVCEGDFAVPEDIPKLVDTILGLWAMCIARKDVDEAIAEVESYVRANKERVFPKQYFGDLPDRMDKLLRPANKRPSRAAREGVGVG